ncbi:MAG: MgtC/SapB family protein, partial [Selenomonadales bacterium]|nr:MgtC/SapB family protein [Selenomonadales bacterium]
MISDVDTAVRLLLSILLGGLVGYERQASNKAAGLRTHVLVCMGSCMIMILSVNVYYTVEGQTNADPARLAAQVISGIGFLGAGTIMKEGPLVTGLTTAASIWVVSAIGLAVGFGYYSGAFLATVLAFATLSLLYQLEKRLKARSHLKVVITLVNDRSMIETMCQTLRLLSADINDIIVDEVEGGEELNVTFLISMRGGRD